MNNHNEVFLSQIGILYIFYLTETWNLMKCFLTPKVFIQENLELERLLDLSLQESLTEYLDPPLLSYKSSNT